MEDFFQGRPEFKFPSGIGQGGQILRGSLDSLQGSTPGVVSTILQRSHNKDLMFLAEPHVKTEDS